MRTYIAKLSTIFTVSFALLIAGCSGITDGNLDEEPESTTFDISTTDSGDNNTVDPQNDDSEPQPIHYERDIYEEVDEDDDGDDD